MDPYRSAGAEANRLAALKQVENVESRPLVFVQIAAGCVGAFLLIVLAYAVVAYIKSRRHAEREGRKRVAVGKHLGGFGTQNAGDKYAHPHEEDGNGDVTVEDEFALADDIDISEFGGGDLVLGAGAGALVRGNSGVLATRRQSVAGTRRSSAAAYGGVFGEWMDAGPGSPTAGAGSGPSSPVGARGRGMSVMFQPNLNPDMSGAWQNGPQFLGDPTKGHTPGSHRDSGINMSPLMSRHMSHIAVDVRDDLGAVDDDDDVEFDWEAQEGAMGRAYGTTAATTTSTTPGAGFATAAAFGAVATAAAATRRASAVATLSPSAVGGGAAALQRVVAMRTSLSLSPKLRAGAGRRSTVTFGNGEPDNGEPSKADVDALALSTSIAVTLGRRASAVLRANEVLGGGIVAGGGAAAGSSRNNNGNNNSSSKPAAAAPLSNEASVGGFDDTALRAITRKPSAILRAEEMVRTQSAMAANGTAATPTTSGAVAKSPAFDDAALRTLQRRTSSMERAQRLEGRAGPTADAGLSRAAAVPSARHTFDADDDVPFTNPAGAAATSRVGPPSVHQAAFGSTFEDPDDDIVFDGDGSGDSGGSGDGGAAFDGLVMMDDEMRELADAHAAVKSTPLPYPGQTAGGGGGGFVLSEFI